MTKSLFQNGFTIIKLLFFFESLFEFKAIQVQYKKVVYNEKKNKEKRLFTIDFLFQKKAREKKRQGHEIHSALSFLKKVKYQDF